MPLTELLHREVHHGLEEAVRHLGPFPRDFQPSGSAAVAAFQHLVLEAEELTALPQHQRRVLACDEDETPAGMLPDTLRTLIGKGKGVHHFRLTMRAAGLESTVFRVCIRLRNGHKPLPMASPIPIEKLLITFYEPADGSPGELHFLRQPLGLVPLDNPLGLQLWAGQDGRLVVLSAGVGTAASTLAVSALGFDPTFNLRETRILLAGIGGLHPQAAPLGSVVVVDQCVDADLAHEISPFEMSPEWARSFIFPLGADRPVADLAPPEPGFRDQHHLRLSQRAVQQAQEFLTGYDPGSHATPEMLEASSGQRPRVLSGGCLSSARYWHGNHLHHWACQWFRHWSGSGQDYTVSSMEDWGVLRVLRRLHRIQRANWALVSAIRVASNHTCRPDLSEGDALSSLRGGGHQSALFPAYLPSLRIDRKSVV